MSKKFGFLESLTTRDMTPADVGRLVEIESEFHHASSLGETDFRWSMRQKHLSNRVIQWKARAGFWTCGYVICDLRQGCVIISSLAVSLDMHRYGIASEVVDRLKRRYCPRNELVAYVPDDNLFLPAHQFFKANRFAESVVVRRFDGSNDYIRFRFNPMKEARHGAEAVDHRDAAAT